MHGPDSAVIEAFLRCRRPFVDVTAEIVHAPLVVAPREAADGPRVREAIVAEARERVPPVEALRVDVRRTLVAAEVSPRGGRCGFAPRVRSPPGAVARGPLPLLFRRESLLHPSEVL